MKSDRREAISDAANALADLTTFHAIIAICESGCFHSESYRGTSQIITICKREAAKRLHEYDRAVARADN